MVHCVYVMFCYDIRSNGTTQHGRPRAILKLRTMTSANFMELYIWAKSCETLWNFIGGMTDGTTMSERSQTLMKWRGCQMGLRRRHYDTDEKGLINNLKCCYCFPIFLTFWLRYTGFTWMNCSVLQCRSVHEHCMENIEHIDNDPHSGSAMHECGVVKHYRRRQNAHNNVHHWQDPQ